MSFLTTYKGITDDVHAVSHQQILVTGCVHTAARRFPNRETFYQHGSHTAVSPLLERWVRACFALPQLALLKKTFGASRYCDNLRNLLAIADFNCPLAPLPLLKFYV